MPRVRTVEQLDQRYLLVPEKVKDAYLVHLIQNFLRAEKWLHRGHFSENVEGK